MTANDLEKTGVDGSEQTETTPVDQRADERGTEGQAVGLSRHALLADCFELMADVLGPFIDERMAGYFEDEESWMEAAANRLGRSNEHGDTDPLFQLLVLRRFWGPVFAAHFDIDLRGIIGELIDTRNKWAHFSLPRDPDSLDRSVLAIERLISPLAPEYSGKLRATRAQLRSSPHLERTGAARRAAAAAAGSLAEPAAESIDDSTEDAAVGPVDSAVDDANAGDTNRAPSATEVTQLASQLTETESVFRDLQERHGDVVSELESSREIAAKKQLLLSALENQLVLIQTRTSAAEAILAEERTTRYRIEWLVVGLLATLTLFLVLANS